MVNLMSESDIKKQISDKETEVLATKKHLEHQKKETHEKLVSLNHEIQVLRSSLSKLKEPELSDHALLRYFERVMGLDVEAAKKSLLTDDVKESILMGAKKIRKDGYQMRISNNIITTIIGED
jgi:predicted nuclease with TOPRIM domain